MISLRPTSILATIFLDIHPYFSIFSRFDMTLPRLLRSFMYLVQLFTIAITCILYYRFSYDGGDVIESNVTMNQILTAIYIGAGLSVLTLPTPLCFLSIFATKLVTRREYINLQHGHPEALKSKKYEEAQDEPPVEQNFRKKNLDKEIGNKQKDLKIKKTRFNVDPTMDVPQG